MYRTSSQTRKPRLNPGFSFARLFSAAKTFALVLFVLGVGVVLVQRSRVSSAKSVTAQEQKITVHAEGRGKGLLKPQDGRALKADFEGGETSSQALRAGSARPLALATADFDLDGAPDLITGYDNGGGGLITLQRGNLEAFVPKDLTAYDRAAKGEVAPSFLSETQAVELPERADFIIADDLNQDSRADLLVAARGGGLYVMMNDGHGALSLKEQIQLPGRVTALVAGAFTHAAGYQAVIAGIVGPDGPALAVIDQDNEGLSSTPLIVPLPAQASNLVLGIFDKDPYSDLAVAAGNEIIIVHGQKPAVGGARKAIDLKLRMEKIETGFQVASVAAGTFVPDTVPRMDLAALATDGTVHIFQRPVDPVAPSGLEARAGSMSAYEYRDEFRRERLEQIKASALVPMWEPGDTAWSEVTQLDIRINPVTNGGPALLIGSSKVSARRMDDLLLLDAGNQEVHVLINDQAPQTSDKGQSIASRSERVPVSLGVEGAPLAVLPMRQNISGSRDLMILSSGHTTAAKTPLLPNGVTLTVNTNSDAAARNTANPNLQCTGVALDCTLREAVLKTNRNSGVNTINVPGNLGTYNLSSLNPNNQSFNGTINLPDLEIGSSINTNTTVIGTVGTPNIVQTIANNDVVTTGFTGLAFPANAADVTLVLQNLDISGGTFTGIFTGADNGSGSFSDTTLTSCNVHNNSNADATFGQGGGHQNQCGSLTVNTTTYSSNQATNSSTGQGGAIFYNIVNASGQCSTGTFTVTDSAFTSNTATVGATFGGGGAIFADVIGSGSATAITKTVFTSNHAAGGSDGGALAMSGTRTCNVNTCTFLTNSTTNASGRGGAIDGISGTLNVNFNRFIGNTTTTTQNGQAIFKNGATFDANFNWWGTNAGPDTSCGAGNPCDVNNSPTLTDWLILRDPPSGPNVHNTNQIAPGASCTVQADILGLHLGGSTSASNLTGLDTFAAAPTTVYSSPVLGTTTPSSPVSSQYVSGVAAVSVTFNSNGTKGNGSVTATADGFSVADTIVIGFTPEFVNPAGVDTVAGGFASNACGGAGFQPCFQTIGFALTNVAISGTINIQTGSYNESALFDSPLCQTCIGNLTGNVSLNTGSLTIGTATFQQNANTFSLTGDFTKTGGTFTPGTGTTNFNGSTNQTITNNAASLTFNNLTVSKSGGALATGANPTTIVTNDLTMTSGNFTAPAALDINGNTLLTAGNLSAGANITAAGNWTNNGGTFTGGSGTVTFDGGTVNQTINGNQASQTFNNFTVNKAGANPLNTGGSTTTIVTNNLTMTLGNFTAPATLDINGNTTLTAGNLTAGANITAAGDWTNNGGTFTPGSGTVTFDGNTVNQVINGNQASQTFNNFAVNKSGANPLSTGGSTTSIVTNNMTMTLGNFTAPALLDINGNTLLTAGTLTAGTNINAAGNWTNDGGTFTPGANTVTFDGSGAQAINGTSTTQGFNNLTVSKSTGTLTAGTSILNVGGNFLLNTSGGTFAQGTSALNVTGNLTANLGTIFTKATGGQALTFNATSGNQSWTDSTAALQDFGNVVVGGTTNTVTLQSNIKMTGLTVNAGDVFFLNQRNLTFVAAAAATNNGTIKLAGNEIFSNVNNFGIASGLVQYVGRNLVENLTVKDFGATDYFNLQFNDVNANKATFILGSPLSVAGDLTISSGTFSPGSQGVGLKGNWTNNSPGIFTPGTSTVTFNSTTAPQSITGGAGIASQIFNNIVVNKTSQTLNVAGSTTSLTANDFTITAGTFDVGTAATVNIKNNWSNGGSFTPGTGKVVFNGTGAGTQTISGNTTFNDLDINHTGGGGVSAAGSTLAVTGTLHLINGTFTSATSYGNVTIDSPAVMSLSGDITVSGNWAFNTGGTFSPGGFDVNFNGAGAQTIGGTATTAFAKLTISNAGTGVSLTHDETANGLLTLTNDLTTGANVLIQPSTAPASAGTGDVIGNVRRTGTPLPNSALTYGNPNNVITLVGSSLTSITMNLTKSVPTVGITGQANSGFPSAVQRTYQLTPLGGAFTSATLQLHYLTGELNGNSEATPGPPASLHLYKLIPAGWQQQDFASGFANTTLSNSSPDNWVKVTNVTGFSFWTIGGNSPTAAEGNVSGRIVDVNGNPVEGAGVRLTGSQNRLTVTDANGNYNFANVETNGFYTVTPTRANVSFSPSQRSFNQLGVHTDAAFTGTISGDSSPLDRTEYFVRQQYVDFLNREPDEAGLNFWVNNIESCGTDATCREAKRTDTSAAFFLSIEFKETGYLVYRTYQSAFGDIPGAPVPVRLDEFQPDTRTIGANVVVNQGDWQQTLEANKQAYLNAFVARSRFASAYPTTMTPAEFVDKLFTNAGVTSDSDRSAAISEFGSASNTGDAAARARALRRVAENAALAQKEFGSAFVLMQYFGYLRRDADGAPDANFSGFDFWLTKLNNFNGDYQQAEMVRAFLVSTEYRGRFPR